MCALGFEASVDPFSYMLHDPFLRLPQIGKPIDLEIGDCHGELNPSPTYFFQSQVERIGI